MGIIPSYLIKEVASNVPITEENEKKYVKQIIQLGIHTDHIDHTAGYTSDQSGIF